MKEVAGRKRPDSFVMVAGEKQTSADPDEAVAHLDHVVLEVRRNLGAMASAKPDRSDMDFLTAPGAS